MNNIMLKSWDYACGDGCCYEYGTEMYINEELVLEELQAEIPNITRILDFLKITYNHADLESLLDPNLEDMENIENVLKHFNVEYEVERKDQSE